MTFEKQVSRNYTTQQGYHWCGCPPWKLAEIFFWCIIFCILITMYMHFTVFLYFLEPVPICEVNVLVGSCYILEGGGGILRNSSWQSELLLPVMVFYFGAMLTIIICSLEISFWTIFLVIHAIIIKELV